MGEKKKSTVRILKKISLASGQEGLLAFVEGQGRLCCQSVRYPDDYWGDRFYTQLTLNGIPLAQGDTPGCPTCASLLAAGYGIEKVECAELAAVSRRINEPFVSLEKSIQDLELLLGLLEPGLYLLADICAFPTDGEGRFFWGLPNGWKEYQATKSFLWEEGLPAFLYPTQSTRCFVQERVSFYRKLYRGEEERVPRAIVYGWQQFLGLLLDGHHKACAAALEGKLVRCVSILPCQGYSYKAVNGTLKMDKFWFAGISLDGEEVPLPYRPAASPSPGKEEGRWGEKAEFASNLMEKEWAQEYLDSGRQYPTAEEYACWLAHGWPGRQLEEILAELSGEDIGGVKAFLSYLSRRKDPRVKSLAFVSCKFPSLREAAFRALLCFREDEEVERFFLDYLVENEGEEHFKKLASSFWEDV